MFEELLLLHCSQPHESILIAVNLAKKKQRCTLLLRKRLVSLICVLAGQLLNGRLLNRRGKAGVKRKKNKSKRSRVVHTLSYTHTRTQAAAADTKGM